MINYNRNIEENITLSFKQIQRKDNNYEKRIARLSCGNNSQKVLTSNLRSMEDGGLVTRKVFPEVPLRVEYTLTETGYSLKPILDSMVDWGRAYKEKNLQHGELQ